MGFVSTKYGIDEKRDIAYKVPLYEDESNLDFETLEDLQISTFEDKSRSNSSFGILPKFIEEAKNLSFAKKAFKDHLYRNERFSLFKIADLKMTSKAHESEEAFWIRVQDELGRLEDEAVEKLTSDFEKDKKRLEKRLSSALDRLDKEQSDVKSQTTDTIITIGASVMGALFGRNLLSRTNVSKAASGVKSAGRILKEKRDVQRAKDSVEELELELFDLEEEFKDSLITLKKRYSRENFELETVEIKPRRADIYDARLLLLWEEE